MEEHTLKIQSKMSKIEALLLDLTNEILTAMKFLFQLRQNSTDIVKNLNSIAIPELYLKEFMNVNCFILKYLNFLTEVNCKFEMMELSQRNKNNFNSINKSILETLSENINRTDPSLLGGLNQIFNFTEDLQSLKKLQVQTFLDAQHTLNLQNSDKSNNMDTFNSINVNEHINTKQKNYLDLNPCQPVISSEAILFDNYRDLSTVTLQQNNNSTSDCLKETFSESGSSSHISSCRSSTKEKCIQTSSENTSFNTLNNSSKNSSPCKIQSETQSVSEDAVETENISIESCNSNSAQNLDSENFKVSQLSRTNDSKTEDEIKPLNLSRKLGEEYDVVIENIKSPSEFYVLIKNNQYSLLVDLENKLKLISKKKKKNSPKRTENKKAKLSKEIGNYALFYSKCDEKWYRAKITNWCLNFSDDFVTVFLLDNGESKCVSVDDLQSMPAFIKEYPAFAQRCHLHGIFPFDLDQNSETLFWEKESTEKMKSVTENSNEVRIKVAANDSIHSATSLPVTLWLIDQGNQCVNQLLVESKLAFQHSDSDHQEVIIENKDSCNEEYEKLNNWNPMKEDFESYQNCYDLDMNNPAAVIYGYVSNDHKRICPHFDKTGYCFKGGACKKEHQKLDPLGFTTDQEETFNNAFNNLPVPPPKAIISVQITCLLSFNQFCCIPTDSFYTGEESLQTLLKSMNKAENLREMKKLLIPPSVGQIVIAQYSEDCSWYRARILESQPEKDHYTVLFVDYGNKEIVKLSSIRAMEARYLHLPFQCMQCFIFGLDRNPKVPLKTVMDYLHERIYTEHITIEVVSKLPGAGTNLLVHVFDHKGNIGEEMIAKEYALGKPEMLISSKSESIPG